MDKLRCFFRQRCGIRLPSNKEIRAKETELGHDHEFYEPEGNSILYIFYKYAFQRSVNLRMKF